MEKNLDSKGRWRNKIVAFRVSPEEAEQIDACVRLSGLSKQDYITKRLTDRKIVVQGNPRVYKALRNQMAEIYEELKRLEKCSEENEAHESKIARLTAEVEKLNERIKCSNEKNNEQWKKLQENRVEISNLNMDVAKRDDEIVKLNKEIEDLKAKLQKYEDKQSAKQDASKQNSTKKSFFGRKK